MPHSRTRASQAPWLAILCLLASLALAGWSVFRHQQAMVHQGPTALAPLADGRVWVVLDQGLILLDTEGRQVQALPLAQLQLPRAPASVGVRPLVDQEELFSMARGHPDVVVHQAHTGQWLRTVHLDWPADLRQHLDGALWLAVHIDGRLAVATGGSHTVALFSPEGRFLARSAPGTFEFTNRLWWEGDTLWATDTNRTALVGLSGLDLHQTQRVSVRTDDALRFLALSDAHPARGVPGNPVATVGLLDHRMQEGRVAFVMPDGTLQTLELPPHAEPRDLAWRREELLVIDSHDWRIRRYGVDGHPLNDYADAALQSALKSQLTERRRALMDHKMAQTGAVGALMLGVAAWVWQRRRQQAPARALAESELRFVGTLPEKPLHQAGKRLLVMAPWLMALACLFLLVDPATSWPTRYAALGGTLAALAVQPSWLKRLARHPAFESSLNQVALHWLRQTPAWAQVAKPGEHVRETWVMRDGQRQRWMVLTSRRLLSLKCPPQGDQPLEARWYRAGIERVRLVSRKRLPAWTRLQHTFAPGVWLQMRMVDGRIVQGLVPSQVTAERVLHHLGIPATQRDEVEPLALDQLKAPAWAPAMTSLLVPGGGQWWQQRRPQALMFFGFWALWLAVVSLPVGLALWHHSTEVSLGACMMALLPPVWTQALAALDAWIQRPRGL
jgi:hypothetical protein